MQRWDIINALIQKNGYKSYLEIGTYSGWNYLQIKCDEKVGVEPHYVDLPGIFKGTSDEFFKQNEATFDIIFIDGLHIWEQCLKDIFNSLNILNQGGTIVVHDCNPLVPSHQTRTATHPEGQWTGDVWKAIAILRSSYPLAITRVVDTDWGCGIIKQYRPDPTDTKMDISFDTIVVENIFEWREFTKHKKEILGLITVDEFKQIYL